MSKPAEVRIPYSEDVEQSLLSAIMFDEQALIEVSKTTPADAFYSERHRRLYVAMIELHGRGIGRDQHGASDPVVLAEHLSAAGLLNAVGGKDYIGHLLDVVPSSDNASDYAAIVRERAAQRHLLTVVRAAATRISEGAPPREIAQYLFNAALPFTVDDQDAGFKHVRDLLYGTLEAIEQRAIGKAGLKTGYAKIDNWTNGFRPGELFIPAGAEKSGKSALAFNIGQRVLEREEGRVGVAYVSAEMGADSLVERALSRISKIDSVRLGAGKLVDHEWAHLARAAGHLGALSLYIDDEAEPSLSDVVARCTHLKALNPHVGLVVVDFLQLITAREKGLSDAVELKRVAYGLKKMAKRLKVVVIAPCQVNSKDVETTKDMRPQLKDLQGSSGMRQAADFIAMMYSPGIYNDQGADADLLELNFAACRRGPRFTAHLRWNWPTMTIND